MTALKVKNCKVACSNYNLLLQVSALAAYSTKHDNDNPYLYQEARK